MQAHYFIVWNNGGLTAFVIEQKIQVTSCQSDRYISEQIHAPISQLNTNKWTLTKRWNQKEPLFDVITLTIENLRCNSALWFQIVRIEI